VISIVICTFNRDYVLCETIKSFFACQDDGIDYELLLVDNNSTDGTKKFAQELAARDHRVRYLFEPNQGLSHARNRGIRESRGESIVFVDDDVFFSPNWLTTLASTLKRHTDALCIGGKVAVHFDSGQPQWIDDDMLWIYGITRYGDYERELHFPEIPRGGNMAFRRTVFEQIGMFHTSLGRKGHNLLSCDENHFLLRAAKKNVKVIYSPDMQIFHRIPASRTNQKWILNRYYWEGISTVAMMLQLDDKPSSRIILAGQAVKNVLSFLHQLKAIVKISTTKKADRKSLLFKKQLDIYYRLGELRQLFFQLFSFKR